MNGAERILAERQRQITVEGWTPEHDNEHSKGELAMAAVCYATTEPLYDLRQSSGRLAFHDPWPLSWSRAWDKRPRDEHGQFVAPTKEQRIRMLEKAGALIAAEIDRLLRP